MTCRHPSAAPTDPGPSISLVVPPLPASLHTQLALLSQLTETGLRLAPGRAAAAWPRALRLTLCRRLVSSAHLLRVLDLLMTAAESALRSDEVLRTVYQRLGQHLASPHHKVGVTRWHRHI